MGRKTKAEAERTRQQILDAARRVFHARGVSRTSLEQIARAAGVSRGAVYWHFANKTELFFAMREQITLPLIDRLHTTLSAGETEDPLLCIERTISELFAAILGSEQVRQTFEIMFLRCEYVDEFGGVLNEINRPGLEFLKEAETAYQRAHDSGALRAGLDPREMALDTWAFVRGLFQHLLASPHDDRLRAQIPAIIAAHVALRRRSPADTPPAIGAPGAEGRA
jgi:TetR/AcrR family transcriptional regulator, acrAB operon repressor